MTDVPIDYGRFEALTFDCYGTLIDWEAGILAGLRRSLGSLDRQPPDDELLERYARAESTLEAGPYLRYREILARCLGDVCRDYGVEPTAAAADAFGASVADWPAFPDSAAALTRLKTRYRLGVPRDRILHVAQSLFHDHVPATRLGFASVWIDRRHDRADPAPPAERRREGEARPRQARHG